MTKSPLINQTRHFPGWRVWLTRVLVAVVLFWNLEASIQFMLKPQLFTHSFQLAGIPGQAAVGGYGILFLMWQVPYVFVLVNPIRFKTSLWQALIMQSIGLIGESLLLATIPADYLLLRGSIIRFIIFDGAGVLILAGALVIISFQSSKKHVIGHTDQHSSKD